MQTQNENIDISEISAQMQKLDISKALITEITEKSPSDFNNEIVTPCVKANKQETKIYLNKLSDFLQAKHPNVIPIPTRSQTVNVNKEKVNVKAPIYASKDLTTPQLWDKWYKVGIRKMYDDPSLNLALLLREDFIVIDIDDHIIGEELEKVCEAFQTTPKQKTKKGVHYFFRRTKECDEAEIYDLSRGLIYEDGKDRPIDIKTKRRKGEAGIISVYPSINKTWERDILTTPLQDLPTQFITFYNDTKKKYSRNTTQTGEEQHNTTTEKTIVAYEDLYEIVNALSFKRYNDYDDWLKCVWAIYNVSYENGYIRKGRNLIHEFSSKHPTKYDEDVLEDIINRAEGKEDGLRIGTLLMYLKEDNEFIFNKMQVKLNPNKVKVEGYSIRDINEYADINIFDGRNRDYDTIKTIFEKTRFKVAGRKPTYIEIRGEGDNEEIVERTRTDFLDTYENLYCYKLLEDNEFEGSKKKKKKKKGGCSQAKAEIEYTNNDDTEFVYIPENFAKKWIQDPQIRTYTAINFLPPPQICPPSVYNTWRGLRAERLTCEANADISPILNHIKITCGNCEKATEYILNWFAHIIQRPGELTGIAICLKSAEGAGKNTLTTNLFGKYILGMRYYRETNNPTDDLFSKHANAYKNTLLINIDEAERKDLHANANRFKSLITNERQRLEEKGVNQCNINSYARYIITTNNDEILKISSQDRRFVLIECSDEKCGDRDYFTNLYKIIKQEEVQKTFYEYLKNRDISKVDWINDRPKTEAYITTLDSNIHPIVRFMASLVCDYERIKVEKDIFKANDLFNNKFHAFLSTAKSKYTCENTYFGRQVGKMGGITKDRDKHGNKYIINFAELKQYLERVEKYDFARYAIIDLDDEGKN